MASSPPSPPSSSPPSPRRGLVVASEGFPIPTGVDVAVYRAWRREAHARKGLTHPLYMSPSRLSTIPPFSLLTAPSDKGAKIEAIKNTYSYSGWNSGKNTRHTGLLWEASVFSIAKDGVALDVFGGRAYVEAEKFTAIVSTAKNNIASAEAAKDKKKIREARKRADAALDDLGWVKSSPDIVAYGRTLAEYRAALSVQNTLSSAALMAYGQAMTRERGRDYSVKRGKGDYSSLPVLPDGSVLAFFVAHNRADPGFPILKVLALSPAPKSSATRLIFSAGPVAEALAGSSSEKTGTVASVPLELPSPKKAEFKKGITDPFMGGLGISEDSTTKRLNVLQMLLPVFSSAVGTSWDYVHGKQLSDMFATSFRTSVLSETSSQGVIYVTEDGGWHVYSDGKEQSHDLPTGVGEGEGVSQVISGWNLKWSSGQIMYLGNMSRIILAVRLVLHPVASAVPLPALRGREAFTPTFTPRISPPLSTRVPVQPVYSGMPPVAEPTGEKGPSEVPPVTRQRSMTVAAEEATIAAIPLEDLAEDERKRREIRDAYSIPVDEAQRMVRLEQQRRVRGERAKYGDLGMPLDDSQMLKEERKARATRERYGVVFRPGVKEDEEEERKKREVRERYGVLGGTSSAGIREDEDGEEGEKRSEGKFLF